MSSNIDPTIKPNKAWTLGDRQDDIDGQYWVDSAIGGGSGGVADNFHTKSGLLIDDFSGAASWSKVLGTSGGAVESYNGGVKITSGKNGDATPYTRIFRTITAGELTLAAGDVFCIELDIEKLWADEWISNINNPNSGNDFVNSCSLQIKFLDSTSKTVVLALNNLVGAQAATYPERILSGNRVTALFTIPATQGATQNDEGSIRSAFVTTAFDYAGFNAAGGTMRIEIAPGSATKSGFGNYKIAIKKMWKNKLCKPSVIYTMDDGYKSWFTYRNEFVSRGIRPTMFVPGSLIENPGTTYMNKAQFLSVINDNGWDAQNHSYNHTLLNTSIPAYQDQKAEIVKEEAWLSSIGIDRSIKICAYPGGDYNADTLSVMADLGFHAGRLAGGAQDDDFMFPYGMSNKYTIPIVGIGENTTATAVLAKIDANAALGLHTIIMGHDIKAAGGIGDQTNLSTLQTVLDGIVTRRDAGAISNMTFAEFVANHT